MYREVGYTLVVDEFSAIFPVPFLIYGREKRELTIKPITSAIAIAGTRSGSKTIAMIRAMAIGLRFHGGLLIVSIL